MPPELSKGSTRRSHRKDALDGHQVREIELKRSRGEISCAECRRLKIKCDKQVPCQSCRRRGCESLCPNDSLTTGQGTRSVLAATEHLYDQINALTKRGRELENALASLQTQVSTETHPLLRGDSSSQNNTDQAAASTEGEVDTPLAEQQLSEYFGTLTISENGLSRFFGPTGGVESLIRGAESHPLGESSADNSDAEGSESPSVPEVITQFSQPFPFTFGHSSVPEIEKVIESQLPPYERALALCEAFSSRLTWIARCVSKSQIMDDLLPAIYSRSDVPSQDCTGPHALALLYTILAIGAVMHVPPPPNRVESERYFQLAKGAICSRSILEKPSTATVQTLQLLSVYMSMRGDDVVDRETRMESTWSLVTLSAHLSHTLGLHRDSARWGLPPNIVERRRRLYWDIFTFDAWQSLITGRPMACKISAVDCPFPEVEDKAVNAAERWIFQFAAHCVAEVAAQAVIPTPPSYANVLELSRKVGDFPMPPTYEQAASEPAAESGDDNLHLAMLHFLLSHSREVILLYIHRSYFIEAITDHPENPLFSQYAQSFLTACRSAGTILRTAREQFGRYPDVLAAVWHIWSFAFSAAVVFGAVVTKGPRSALAPAAMEELEQAYVLLTRAAPLNPRAAEALPIIIRLRKKARDALNDADKPAPEADEAADELSIFAGRATVVSHRRRSRSPRALDKSRYSECTTPATSGSSYVSPRPSPGPPSTSTSTSPPCFPASDDMAGADWSYNYYDAYDGHYLPPPPQPQQQPAFSQNSFSQGAAHGAFPWTASQPFQQYQLAQVPMDIQYQQPGPASSYGQHPAFAPPQSLYFGPTPSYEHPSSLSIPETTHQSTGHGGDAPVDQRWTNFVRDSGILDGPNFL